MHLSTRLFAIAVPLALAAPAAHADVVISNATTQNMTCSVGVCAPTAADAVLNVADLEVLLNSGATEVTTTGAEVQAGNIVVSDALTWTSANALTLDAYQSIRIDKLMSVDGTAGLVLTTDQGGTNGTLSFGPSGRVTFQNLSNALTINGTAYTLENSVKTLASAIAASSRGAYALANDYDAGGDGTYSRAPIKKLFGSVEGLGNTISNLTIRAKSKRGLYTGFIEEVEKGHGDFVPSISSLRLTALNVDAAGSLRIGGLVVINEGNIFDDHISGTIVAEGEAAGGLVYENEGEIISSSADVSVSAHGGVAGGLVALNEGTIDQSYASGSVTVGSGYAGGLAGGSVFITDSYAVGSVQGPTSGGLIGVSQSDDNNAVESYSTGTVSGSTVGGFVGDSMYGGYCTACYWDTTTSETDQGSGNGNLSGITGLTTTQLKSGLPAGFDPAVWAEDKKINNGLPYLINNPPEK